MDLGFVAEPALPEKARNLKEGDEDGD